MGWEPKHHWQHAQGHEQLQVILVERLVDEHLQVSSAGGQKLEVDHEDVAESQTVEELLLELLKDGLHSLAGFDANEEELDDAQQASCDDSQEGDAQEEVPVVEDRVELV